MKKVLLCTVILAAVLQVTAQKTGKTPVKKPTAPPIKTLLDSFSYAAGFNVANNMKEQGITEVNTELMKRGMDDFLKKQTPLLAPEIGNQSLQRQLDVFAKAKAAAAKIKADSVHAAGIAFLENNKKRKGITTLPDGLQYEIIVAGDTAGSRPKLEDTVVVNYIGRLTDGFEFENSFKRGQPAVFRPMQMIRGWSEVLQLMPAGSQWRVWIPAELAYGDNPPPNSGIPQSATLVFEISLETIKPAIAKAAQ